MSLEKTIEKFRYLERNGIIGRPKRLFNFTDEPHFFQYSCSCSGNFDEKDGDGIATDTNKENAKVKALGECIERYALQSIPEGLIVKSFNNLHSKAINPSIFVNFREQDMGHGREEYITKLLDNPISWISGKNIKTNDEILIPAQLVYVPFRRNEPLIRSQISTGAAAHEDYEKAVIGGILEVIERDAFMLSYLSKDNSSHVKLNGELAELEDYFKRYYLTLRVFDITSDLNIPSFICINLDYTGVGPAVSVGLSSDFFPRKAIFKAIMESQQSRQWMRYNQINEGKIVDNPSDINSVKDRGYYWSPRDRIKDLDFLLNNGKYKEINEEGSCLSITDFVEHLYKKGVTSYVVDITPKEVRDAGFTVIKAILPELHPLFLYEDFPHLYSKRLDSHLNGRELNLVPHPFM